MQAAYPRSEAFPADATSEREIGWLQALVLAVRQIRGEMNINPSRRIPVLLQGASAQDRADLKVHRASLERLAGIESIRLLESSESAPQCATALLGSLTVLVPMAGLIDAAAEAERLGKLLARAQADLTKVRARLANESFAANAPAAVVAAERERVVELERTAAGLTAQLERVRSMLEEPTRTGN